MMAALQRWVSGMDSKRAALAASAAASAVYFFALLRFYLVDYYVPDFRLYHSFAAAGYKAKDGFSSLFIWLAGLSGLMPRAMTVGCLLLLALSLFNLMLFYWRCFYSGWQNYMVVMVIAFSCGCWYYFYGKLFYDFPLSAYTFSLGLVFLSRLMGGDGGRRSDWLVFCALMGLCLSWKPYNVFMVAGLGLLMLAHGRGRAVVAERFFEGVKKALSSLAALALGYVAGNFNLLASPRETIEGIRAYSASFSFLPFLFGKGRVIWDHVNDEAFHLSVFNMVIAAALLFVLPVLLGKIRYALVSAFMAACLYVYVTRFSPGYAWHGFPFGVFMILLAMFLLDGIAIGRGFKEAVLAVSLASQVATCFFVYVPGEARWHSVTQEAIAVLEGGRTAYMPT